jgi:hypothetical protein
MVNNGLLGEFGEYRKHYMDAIPDEGFYLNNLSRHEASAVRSASRDKITAEFIKILNKIHFELIRKLEQHLAAPHMAKALEPLDKQCNWIYKDAKILKRFSKYIPVANWVYSLAPEYPDSKEMDKMQAMVKGYQYIPIAKRNNIKPGETVDMYPVAVVATDDRFYSDMIKRMAGRDKTKTITKRHAQKIIKSLVDANVFERRPGQRANYLIVGYYFTNMTRYYKRPIMTKKMSAAKLRKFKIF